jgi:AraC-like DNA-binding protein
MRGGDMARAAGTAELLADRVRIALLASAGVPTDLSLQEDARERVKAYVQAHLHDPQLSLDHIASALGFSKRYLHKLFSEQGETLASWIWQARLAGIRKALADPRERGRSITDIAFSWGFNSATHFSRSFRRRYGVAPREFRLAADEAA